MAMVALDIDSVVKMLISGGELGRQSGSGRDALLCYPGRSVRDTAEGHRPGRSRVADLTPAFSQGQRKRRWLTDTQ